MANSPPPIRASMSVERNTLSARWEVLAQDRVADRVTVVVVDRLEVVEVDDEHRERLVIVGRRPARGSIRVSTSRRSASSKARRLATPVSGSLLAISRWRASASSRRRLRLTITQVRARKAAARAR